MSVQSITQAYELAKARYADLGVDTDAAIAALKTIPISLHCWQGDDVRGFESPDGELTGGLVATGNYPGKARNGDELRRDLDMAYSVIPGTHRLNLHMLYAETNGIPVERNALLPQHFSRWVDWARANQHGIDFNPSCFSHPLSADGFTLASADDGVRQFWIEHCIAARKIGAYFGQELGTPCITNVWIPDGYKDIPADRLAPRERLLTALDAIFVEDLDPNHNKDAVESKLFGIGSESYVVGSHEFYLGYAMTRSKVLCLDAGHYHPTEGIADKISSSLLYLDELLLHVSRGVRWDSDHVVTLSDDLRAIMEEVVRSGEMDRINIGLDFFDASINRVAAWVIGTRNALKALLLALLEPREQLRQYENAGDFTARLLLIEELKTMPFAAIWDFYCETQSVPVGMDLLEALRTYEKDELLQRV